MEYAALQWNFYQALAAMEPLPELLLSQLGIDWNSTYLEWKKRKLKFRLAEEHIGQNSIEGLIHDSGHRTPIITVTEGMEHLGSLGMTNYYIVHSLSEAVAIASKLEVMERVEFLPSGPAERTPSGIGGWEMDQDIELYKRFVAELLARSKSIIVGRVNQVFDKYLVVKTAQDWFVAYNKNYGEAPYVVTDINDLFLDKQTLIRTKGAFHFRRDTRGNQWIERLREFL